MLLFVNHSKQILNDSFPETIFQFGCNNALADPIKSINFEVPMLSTPQSSM